MSRFALEKLFVFINDELLLLHGSMELRRRSSDSSAWSRPAIDIQALSKQAQTVFHSVFAVEEFKFNASRQSGFQLWGQRSRGREGRCVSR